MDDVLFHINGTNNRSDNLIWIDTKENNRQQRIDEAQKLKKYPSRRNRTFFTNADNDQVSCYLTAAKFAGIKLKIYKDTYDIGGNLISGTLAIHWTCQPTKRQRRLFILYLNSFRYLHEDEITQRSKELRFDVRGTLGWYRR